jgi:putative zinc finger protein
MANDDVHPSDQVLLLAADGELSARQQNEVQKHLQSCWSCRKRKAEIERTIGNFVDCYFSLIDPKAVSDNNSGAILRTRLSRQLSRPSWFVRIAPLLQLKWPLTAACALVIACLSCIFLLQRETRSALIPNPRLTPGETIAVNKYDVCRATPMNVDPQVPENLREAVFSEYGMKNAPRNAYEVDLLITPELGGSVSIRNLWPQPYSGAAWNAHRKDALEERLRRLVCNGDLDLSTAQHEIATNWVDAYKKYVGVEQPM